MNEYYVKYFDKGIMKTMRNIKSKEDAKKLAKSLDSEFGTVVGWKELETEELTPFPNIRSITEYICGNIVRVVKSYYSIEKDNDVGKLAIVVGSTATLCNVGVPISSASFHTYKLAFIDGGFSDWKWWWEDKLEFIAIGDPILVNLWLKKYHVRDDDGKDDSICLIDEIKKIGK